MKGDAITPREPPPLPIRIVLADDHAAGETYLNPTLGARKLRLSGRAGLVAYALDRGLIKA